MKFKKKSKKIFTNKDAGNVELNTSVFNHMSSVDSAPSTDPSGPMGEAMQKNLGESDMNKDTVTLVYPKLFVDDVVVKRGNPHGYYDHSFGNWLPDDDVTEDMTFENFEYEVDKDVVEELLSDFVSEYEVTDDDYSEHEDDYNEFVYAIVEKNFDELVDKYQNELLDHFQEDAADYARLNYDPDSYYDESLQCDRDKNESLRSLHQDKDMYDDTFENVILYKEPCYNLYKESTDTYKEDEYLEDDTEFPMQNECIDFSLLADLLNDRLPFSYNLSVEDSRLTVDGRCFVDFRLTTENTETRGKFIQGKSNDIIVLLDGNKFRCYSIEDILSKLI